MVFLEQLEICRKMHVFEIMWESNDKIRKNEILHKPPTTLWR
jgi:hypothetical protein